MPEREMRKSFGESRFLGAGCHPEQTGRFPRIGQFVIAPTFAGDRDSTRASAGKPEQPGFQ
jgi:hypothetical protein